VDGKKSKKGKSRQNPKVFLLFLFFLPFLLLKVFGFKPIDFQMCPDFRVAVHFEFSAPDCARSSIRNLQGNLTKAKLLMALPELLWVKRIAADAQGFSTAEGGEFYAEFSQRKI
jgi:hypothetical protein